MSQLLKEFIKNNVKIDEDGLNQICPCFKPYNFSKGELILSKGEIPPFFYFVLEGCLRVYVLLPDGKEFTRYIAFEGMFCAPFPGFVNQRPSFAFLDALATTKVLAISYHDFQQLLKESPAFEKIYRIVLEKSYVDSILRIEDLISLNSKERYQKIMKESPHLIQLLPNRILANYMGISQETLSRLKSSH